VKTEQIYIEQYLKDVKREGIKDLVLGCTHYPLLEKDIKNYLGDINCYNMGTILAVNTYLKPGNKSLNIYFSHNYDGLKDKVNEILEQKVVIIEQEV